MDSGLVFSLSVYHESENGRCLYSQRSLIAFLNLVTSRDYWLKELNQSKFKPYAV